MKVYYQDAKHYRLSIPQPESETDVIANGSKLWLWDSTDNSVTEFIPPAADQAKHAAPKLPQTPLTPQQAANQVLTAVGKTTLVSVQANVMVAGEPSYQLVLAPKDSPLAGRQGRDRGRRQVRRAAARPALRQGREFPRLPGRLHRAAVRRPGLGQLQLHPAARRVRRRGEPGKGAGQVRAAAASRTPSGFGTYGKSWLTVVALPAEGPHAGIRNGFWFLWFRQFLRQAAGHRLEQQQGVGVSSQELLNALLGSAKPVHGSLGERHPGHHQPGLDAHDRRRGLHRRGRSRASSTRRWGTPPHDPRRPGQRAGAGDRAELAIASSALTKRFRGGQLAVDHVDLAVPRGAVYGFLGPNGSGKTTTIRMLLGLAYPTSGSAELLGVPMPEGATRVLSRVGSLVEGPAFYPYLSGWDNLARYDAADRTASAGTAKARIGEAMERVGLTAAAKKKFRNYSLGMKQRLAIAAALLTPRDLIILDEPTNGLDPQGTREVRALVRQIAADGITVFVSSHLLAEVEQVSTHVGVMRLGKLVFQGELAALRRTAAPQGRGRAPATPAAAAEVLAKLGLADPVLADDLVTAELGDVAPEKITAELVHAGRRRPRPDGRGAQP